MTDERLPIPWKDLRRAFNFDGSLRDIVVLEADRQLWQQTIDYVRQLNCAGSVRLDEGAPPLPDDVGNIFALSAQGEARLSIDLGRIRVNCFFFADDEIEFDLDPREVTSEEDATSLLGFMRGLGEAAGRNVHLTEENAHDWRWLTFDPATSAWSFEPADQ